MMIGVGLLWFGVAVTCVVGALAFSPLPPANTLYTSKVLIHRSASSDSLTESVSNELLQSILDVAVDAAKKAGKIIIGNAGGAEVTKSKTNSRDLLTLIDPLCEKVSFTL